MISFILLFDIADMIAKYMSEHPEVIRKLCEIIWGVFFKPFMQEIAKILADRLLKRGKKNACRKKSENKKGKEKACKEKNDDRKLEDDLEERVFMHINSQRQKKKHNDNGKLEDDKKRVFMYIQRQTVKDNKMYKRYNPNCLIYLGTVSIRVK